MCIFDIHHDYALCDKTFCQYAIDNNRIRIKTLCDKERVVTLVWYSLGLIGNGGFRYYFEGKGNGDPGCVNTIAAYKQIGAMRAYMAFTLAEICFPSFKIPSDRDDRLQVLSSITHGTFNRADSLFLDAINEAVTCLARFIRSHQHGHSNLIPDKAMAEPAHSENHGESLRI